MNGIIAGIMLLFVIVAGVGAMYMFASQNNAPITDTYGGYAGNITNNTQSTLVNASAPVGTLGTAIGVIVAVIVFFSAILALVIYGLKGRSGYSRSRY